MYGIARPRMRALCRIIILQAYEYGCFAKRRGRWKPKWVVSHKFISYCCVTNYPKT